MIFSIPTSSEITTRIAETVRRFPLALISTLIVTAILIYLIEVEPKKIEGIYLSLAKIALTGSLAVLVFTASRLLGESIKGHKITTFFALFGVVAYYMILPNNSSDFEVDIIHFRHLFLSLLFLVALLWTPFVHAHLHNSDYWEYSKRVLFALIVSFIFTIVVILGINGAIFAIEKLFDFDMESKRYFQMDILIVGLFGVGYFLSEIPKNPLLSKDSISNSKIEIFFTKWLLTPLSGLYFVILYAYSAKLLITLDLPKGILAWLVVMFSTVAILTYLFWTPFAKEQNSRWRKWIWIAVLFQTIMLFIAIGIRVEEYSWTESRYMVFLLGLWLAGVSLYFLIFKNAKIKWIFISLSLLIALTQFGVLSAYNVSKNAQMDRLKNLLVELKKSPNTSKAPLKVRYEISDITAYLYRRYRGNSLVSIFPNMTKEFKKLQAEREVHKKKIEEQRKKGLPLNFEENRVALKANYFPHYVTEELGFKFINYWEYKNNTKESISFHNKTYSNYRNKMIEIKGYNYMTHIGMGGYYNIRENKNFERADYNDINLSFIYTNSKHLTIHKNNIEFHIDMSNFLENLIKKYGKKSKEIEQEELTIRDKKDGVTIKLKLDEISMQFYEGNETIEFRGVFFIR